MSNTIEDSKGSGYAYDIARQRGMTEGELAVERLGDDASYLEVADIKKFIGELERLGEVKVVTRNDYAISTQIGEFKNQHLYGYKTMDVSARAGLILNPREMDLRIFFAYWKYLFFIADKKRGRSIHIFDDKGVAMHKVYATENTNERAFDMLLEKYLRKDAKEISFNAGAARRPGSVEARLDEAVDTAWREMKDPHDFYMLMHRFRMDRLDLIRSVRRDLAYPVRNVAVEDVLHIARERGVEIALFVGNAGTVQIATCVPDKIFRKDEWLNVFNKGFSFHLLDQCITSCWVVKKPCAQGHVTSVEAFAEDGTQIVQIFGQRDENEPERSSWREIVDAVSGA